MLRIGSMQLNLSIIEGQSFLIFRIAPPGATPLGHAFTQFIMRSHSGVPFSAVAASRYLSGFFTLLSSAKRHAFASAAGPTYSTCSALTGQDP